MSNQHYAARQVGNLWAVCTASQIVANYVSESLAIQSVNELLGLNVTELEPSTPSTFLATWGAALASTASQLQDDLDSVATLGNESNEELKSEVSKLAERLQLELAIVDANGSESDQELKSEITSNQSEIELLKRSLQVEQMRRELVEAESDYAKERSRLLAAMEANRLAVNEVAPMVDAHMAQSSFGQRVRQLREAVK